jgi:hypothetical protein
MRKNQLFAGIFGAIVGGFNTGVLVSSLMGENYVWALINATCAVACYLLAYVNIQASRGEERFKA